jgi:hypothetical protein
VGATSKGSSLIHVPFLANVGGLVSEASYPIKVDAVFVHGADYIRADPDGAHVRLEVSSVLRDRATGALIRYDYTGTIDVTGGAGKVLRGEPDAATTDFGDACEPPLPVHLQAEPLSAVSFLSLQTSSQSFTSIIGLTGRSHQRFFRGG